MQRLNCTDVFVKALIDHAEHPRHIIFYRSPVRSTDYCRHQAPHSSRALALVFTKKRAGRVAPGPVGGSLKLFALPAPCRSMGRYSAEHPRQTRSKNETPGRPRQFRSALARATRPAGQTLPCCRHVREPAIRGAVRNWHGRDVRLQDSSLDSTVVTMVRTEGLSKGTDRSTSRVSGLISNRLIHLDDACSATGTINGS